MSQTNQQPLTLVGRALCAIAAAVLSFATALAQKADISDAEALRRFAPEFADSNVGFQLTEKQQEFVPGRVPGLGYRFSKDLNADGRPEIVLFGHGTKADVSQSFVLIVTQKADGTFERSKIFTFTQPYLVGEVTEKGINVFFCEACDAGGRVTWNGSDYEFTPF
jgi:hypothetical protein